MAQNSDRALRGWLASAPRCLGFELENVKAGGGNHLTAFSFMGLGLVPTAGGASVALCVGLYVANLGVSSGPGGWIPRMG